MTKMIKCERCPGCGLNYEAILRECPFCSGSRTTISTLKENVKELSEECKNLRYTLAAESDNANKYAHERDQAKQRLKTVYEMLKSWAL